MEKLWTLEFNIFSMMAVGFLIRKIRLVGKEAERVLTDLVLYVVLPCNIFNSFLGDHGALGAGDYLAVLLISIGIQILSLAYGKFAFPRENPDRRVNLSYAMICSNAGFLGNPVAEGVFGATGLMLASIYLIPQRVMMWSEGLAIYSGVKDGKRAVIKVVTHPCVIACALGLIVMALNITVPALLLTPIQQIGRCNTPLTMMMIGMILSEIDLKHLADRTVLWFTVHRLILMPLVVYLMCLLLSIDKTVTGVCVLLAAMPAGATTSMLSAKYGRDPQFATKLVVFTTLCSIPAIFLWSVALV
ncbi:MAG: AEC family transporter [Deltaproteobacteria bacterium]|nr:AEC family transporter [Deltaproteobacteria bacterium]